MLARTICVLLLVVLYASSTAPGFLLESHAGPSGGSVVCQLVGA
jgi:hypothetical protein